MTEHNNRWALLSFHAVNSVTNMFRSSHTLTSLETFCQSTLSYHWWVLVDILYILYTIVHTKLCDGAQVDIALIVGALAPKQYFIVHYSCFLNFLLSY